MMKTTYAKKKVQRLLRGKEKKALDQSIRGRGLRVPKRGGIKRSSRIKKKKGSTCPHGIELIGVTPMQKGDTPFKGEKAKKSSSRRTRFLKKSANHLQERLKGGRGGEITRRKGEGTRSPKINLPRGLT